VGKINKHASKKYLVAVTGVCVLVGILISVMDQSPHQKEAIESDVISNKVDQITDTSEVAVDQPEKEMLNRYADKSHASEEVFEAIEFNSIEDILENIDDPAVQAYVNSLPEEAQESIYIASLKQSVSKRLDDIETSSHADVDIDVLFQDIDMLRDHKVMMPGEVESLKAYVLARQ